MSEYLSSLLAEPERFEITDDGKAEWAIQKIREANSDTVKWQEHFAQQLAKIKAENDSTAAYMTGLLADYFATVPHKETKTQSTYKLPSATLIRKQQQARKRTELTPIYTCGGHSMSMDWDDDDEDFWCPICHVYIKLITSLFVVRHSERAVAPFVYGLSISSRYEIAVNKP